ncbi:hypothetical protein EK21DRAFT_113264 [Setomelanomma holmii]|uniref:Protein kinase domain-containing protein n=1 Tax=Setomelanomma holmii TaxID=210430 RepID=A0A9P4LLV7_9PLEO|nr:hypothetical protein EK21DRAFT_113264 [Setomelanomma holmii]
MGLGLDYIHNGLSKRYVHIDIKPDYIFTLTPPDYTDNDIPIVPHFKIADFARLTEYPAHSERLSNGRPVDIWALAATIQNFALGIKPTQSRAAFIVDCKAQGLHYPQDDDEWYLMRSLVPVMYRPIDATAQELRDNWDVDDPLPHHEPYSHTLNTWYKSLFNTKPFARLNSARIRKHICSTAERHVKIELDMEKAREHFENAKKFREGAEERRKEADCGVQTRRAAVYGHWG